MNTLRTHHVLRLTLVVAMLLGWFALSQRCALAQMLKAQQAAAVQHDCCEKNRAPAEETPAKGNGDCCHALSVLVPDGANVVKAAGLADLWPVVKWVVAALELRAPARVVVAEFDPPPERRSFTELVLQRSLLSHAPPFAA